MFKESHSDSNKSLLWLQYMHPIEVFLRFFKPERSSKWKLHLQAVREMMPYFALSGHHVYVKSSY